MTELNDKIPGKFLLGKCTENELSLLNTWIKESDENARKLFLMEEIYQLGKSWKMSDEQRLAQAEKEFYKRLQQEKLKEKILQMRNRMKYAAVIALFLLSATGLWYGLSKGTADKGNMIAIVSGNDIKEILLPDGTRVWLNHSATLKYPHEFSKNERNVFLDGEAYFEVIKDCERPFIVQSDAMSVKVLGTVFNFKSCSSDESAMATLIEGEIEVKGNNAEGGIILSPGQKAELDRTSKRLTVKQVNAKLDAVWHDNLIPFEKADIFSIAKTLEKFYDVKITISPEIQGERTYSGVLKQRSDIKSVLNSLRNSIPIEYKVEGKRIYIFPKRLCFTEIQRN